MRRPCESTRQLLLETRLITRRTSTWPGAPSKWARFSRLSSTSTMLISWTQARQIHCTLRAGASWPLMTIRRPLNFSRRLHSSILVRQLTGPRWPSFITRMATTAIHLRTSSRPLRSTHWRARFGTISASSTKNASNQRKLSLLTPRFKTFKMAKKTR